MVDKVHKTDAEWKSQLTPRAVPRRAQEGHRTRVFRRTYWDNHRAGLYRCICCGTPLFASDTKFESGTGWPSFWSPDRAGERPGGNGQHRF